MTNPTSERPQPPTETPPMQDERESIPRDGGSGLAESDGVGALVGADNGAQYRARWSEIQSRFVDSPRDSVEQADALVTEVMESVSRGFTESRTQLEKQWEGGEPATDELRHALQQYRSFFERLLAA